MCETMTDTKKAHKELQLLLSDPRRRVSDAVWYQSVMLDTVRQLPPLLQQSGKA